MVEKIIVNPSEVRGLGNIVSPKTTEDFTNYMSGLTENEGIYTLVYDGTGTHLTLSASPTTISYGGSTVFTAVLIQTGEPVEGETVSFYEGETLLGTDTTDSNGEATLTKSDFTVGSHSVKAVYDEVESGTVSVTVNKLASTITLSVPASGTVGTSYTVSGTLVPASGSVKLYENGSLKDTLTVSSGTFSKAITQSNEGTYSYYAVFEGSSTYSSVTSSTGSIVVSDVPTPVPASVDLTGTKSILSYADSESCTLTATVLDSSDNPIQGATVELYKDSVLWDTLTTDSSGECSKTYSSAGSGDVTFEAKCNLLTKTYEVEDCLKYDSNTYSSYNVSLNYNLPSHFKIEYESYITQTSNNSCFVRVGESDSKALLTGKVGSGDSVWKVTVRTSSSGTGDITNTGGTISLSNDWQPNTITYDGISYKFHDITVTNLNGVSLDKLVSFATWKQSTTSGQIRHIKIKPL